jgi:hypothetical protein
VRDSKLRRIVLFLFCCAIALPAFGQIDPVKRQLIQLGYNQPLVGNAPFAGYAFYYRNDPGFLRTNLTLRLAIAPVYLDSELGISHALGENTDIGVGLAGGGFADSYAEFQRGEYERKQSFTGNGGEVSMSVYHCFNPGQKIPLNGVLRGSLHYSAYERDDETDNTFQLPDNRMTTSIRTGLRWGGKEPTLYPSLGMELSVWYEGQFRSDAGKYGYAGDRRLESNSHLFWAQALIAYTLPSKQNFYLNVTAGMSVNADRFSAYRLGALLPLVSEFPLSLPGYYYQEISAERFVLIGANYILPLDEKKHWNLNFTATTAFVDYLPGLSQPGNWHSGFGGGVLYKSSSEAVKIMVGYGYGIDAIRGNNRGGHAIGMLMQIDLEQARDLFDPGFWRGLQRNLWRIGN